MAILAVCSGCNVRLTLGDDRAGDRFECPQCDATIKVPLGDGPPPAPARKQPAAQRAAAPEPDDDAEPVEGTLADKRVQVGIIAGVCALVLVGVLVAVFAFRKPAETVKRDAGPNPAETAAAPAPPRPAPAPEPRKPEPVFTPDKPEPARPPEPPKDVAALQYNAQFLGSQGQGRRFCIIADNSGSMSGAKIADLRAQLLKTLKALNGDGEFYVYCFNSKTEPMPHPTWLKAGAPEAEKVRAWVGDIRATGGTQPVPAFEAAFKLRPPPDVIFFMTDGLIPANVPDRVVALNAATPKVVVNTIMFANPEPKVGAAPPPLPFPPKGAGPFPVPPKMGFGPGRAEEFLKRIAEQNGGTFTRYTPGG